MKFILGKPLDISNKWYKLERMVTSEGGESMKQMMFWITEEQHRQLKSKLAAEGITLREWGQAIVTDFVAGVLACPSLSATELSPDK